MSTTKSLFSSSSSRAHTYMSTKYYLLLLLLLIPNSKASQLNFVSYNHITFLKEVNWAVNVRNLLESHKVTTKVKWVEQARTIPSIWDNRPSLA